MSAAAPPALRPGAPGLGEPRRRRIVTPEGVPIGFEVALAGDRLAAFLLDLLAILLLVAAVLVPAFWLAAQGRMAGDLVQAAALLVSFLARTFYFAFFELAWQGQTPGKRRLRLRAVDAGGGPLSAEGIIARNLTRELEVYLPLVALVAPQLLYAGAPGWARLVALGWMLVFGLLPLFNRDRLRVGDLIGGTVVIRTPRALLLRDLADGEASAAALFTEAQLDVYGVYELQVLEGVLRDQGKPGNAEALRTVATQVRAKLGWEGPATADGPFLTAFYAALRARLERRLLFGKRRADKHDRAG